MYLFLTAWGDALAFRVTHTWRPGAPTFPLMELPWLPIVAQPRVNQIIIKWLGLALERKVWHVYTVLSAPHYSCSVKCMHSAYLWDPVGQEVRQSPVRPSSRAAPRARAAQLPLEFPRVPWVRDPPLAPDHLWSHYCPKNAVRQARVSATKGEEVGAERTDGMGGAT